MPYPGMAGGAAWEMKAWQIPEGNAWNKFNMSTLSMSTDPAERDASWALSLVTVTTPVEGCELIAN